jgi:ubiquinone/menaquinone biosynthesis C-methylase UbiE
MNERFPLIRKVHPRRRREMPVNENFPQNLVDKTFQSNAEYWKSVYRERSLTNIIHQYPQAAALHMVDALNLPKESNVLELGCGAGVLTVALARRKYIVTAIDRVRASLDLVHQRAIEVGLQKRIITSMGDMHTLEFKDQSFDLVLALGVIPWLHSPRAGMMEIMRVLKPGGYAIISVDNRWRMIHILDPRFNPLLLPIRETVQHLFETLKLRRPDLRASFPRMHSINEFDSLLTSIGLHKSAGQTHTFGPFTLMNKRIFSDSIGKIFHHVFQSMADRNVPGIRSAGSQYQVLAQKPEPIRQQDPAAAKDFPATDFAKTESYIL